MFLFNIRITHQYIHIIEVWLLTDVPHFHHHQYTQINNILVALWTADWSFFLSWFCPSTDTAATAARGIHNARYSVNNPRRICLFPILVLINVLWTSTRNLCLHVLTSRCLAQIKACKCASHLFLYFIQDEARWHLTVERYKELHQHWSNSEKRKGCIH